MSSLQAFYEYIANIHSLTGFVGKVPLLAILFAVWGGNRNPGNRLLFGVLGAELLMASWIGFDFRSSSDVGSQAGSAVLLPALIALLLGIYLVVLAVMNLGGWELRGGPGWRRGLGWLVIAYGIYYPHYTDGLVRPLFFSPTVAIPHPILLVFGGLAILSASSLPRHVGWVAAGALLLLGLGDVLLGDIAFSWALVLVAVAVVAVPSVPALPAARSSDSDPVVPRSPARTPSPRTPGSTPRPKAMPTPSPRKESGGKKREWKLK